MVSRNIKKFLYLVVNMRSLAGWGRLTIICLFITPALINFGGCCGYSFTGASVPAHLTSIAIPVADDRSGAAEPGLRESFTNLLIRKFTDDNTLRVTDRTNANSLLECTIITLSDAPAVVTAGESVATRRITITVHVVFRDLVQKKVIYERNFSNNSDYASGGDIAQRQEAIQRATDLITDDVLLDTISGW